MRGFQRMVTAAAGRSPHRMSPVQPLFSPGWWRGQNAGDVPLPAMIKAALGNGAVDMSAQQTGMPGGSTLAPIPNDTEGWGCVNLAKTAFGICLSWMTQPLTLEPLQAAGR
ncbi:MAG: hypothetical protein RML57_01985 [Acidobacteriota bacterium]|nr:hypothetical protein [Acidobacteriota bacterium]